MTNTYYPKLRGRIYEKYGSLSAFADALGVSKQVISQKLNKHQGFTIANIGKWSELLDIQQEEIGVYFFDWS